MAINFPYAQAVTQFDTFVLYAFIQIAPHQRKVRCGTGCSQLSRSSHSLSSSFSLSHSFLLSFPATAPVTNNRSSGIYFITTRVSMPARLSLYAPLEPVIITYHLFLPANAGIGATLLCTHCPKANSLPSLGGETIPSSTTEPSDNKYSTTNLLTAMKLCSISLARTSAFSLTLSISLFFVNHETARPFKKIHDRVRPDDCLVVIVNRHWDTVDMCLQRNH